MTTTNELLKFKHYQTRDCVAHKNVFSIYNSETLSYDISGMDEFLLPQPQAPVGANPISCNE